MNRLSAYRDKDFQTPAIGFALRLTSLGIQIGRRCYIVRWGK